MVLLGKCLSFEEIRERKQGLRYACTVHENNGWTCDIWGKDVNPKGWREVYRFGPVNLYPTVIHLRSLNTSGSKQIGSFISKGFISGPSYFFWSQAS